jgi:hypothetical protein
MAIKRNQGESGLFLGNLINAMIGICLLRGNSDKKDLTSAVRAEWPGAERAPRSADIIRSLEQLVRAGAVDWSDPPATGTIRLTPEGKRQAEEAAGIIRAGRESFASRRAANRA